MGPAGLLIGPNMFAFCVAVFVLVVNLFIFFNLFISIGGLLLYNIVVVFATH